MGTAAWSAAHPFLPSGAARTAWWIVAMSAALVALVVGVRRHRPVRPFGWLWLATGFCIYVLANIGLAVMQRLPIPDDVALTGGSLAVAAALPPMIVGIHTLLRSHDRAENREAVADGAILTLAGSYFAYQLIVARGDAQQTANMEPLVHLVLIVAVIVVAGLSTGRALTAGVQAPSLRLLCAGMWVGAVSLVAYWHSGTLGPYEATTWAAPLGSLCYGLIGASALHPSMVDLTRPGPPRAASAPRTLLISLSLFSIPVGHVLMTGPVPATHQFIAEVVIMSAVSARLLLYRRDRERAHQRLHHQSRHDVLTGLPNRALLMEHLSTRTGARGTKALLFLDLDRFKVVNDSLGHLAGDELLLAVAERLQQHLRSGDIVARVGGDEFVVLCEQVAGAEGALLVAERLLGAFADPFSVGDRDLRVTASIGVRTFVDGGDTPEVLLRDADTALYVAKESGRARCELYEAPLGDRVRGRLELETELDIALKRGELTVLYQPLVSLVTGTVESLEALVRWHHPTRGVISPCEFIPMAEDSGQIVEVGRYVLGEVADQLARLRDANPGLRVSVNVSAIELRRSGFSREFVDLLSDRGIAPSRLRVEVTETAMLTNTSNVLETLRALRAAGAQVALDDFGTGYSSLSYLKRFPVDYVKVDRSFVDGVATDEDDAAIVAAIVAMSHALDLEVIAEGVEQHAQALVLQQMGCDLAQGYLIDPPTTFDRARQARLPVTAAEDGDLPGHRRLGV